MPVPPVHTKLSYFGDFEKCNMGSANVQLCLNALSDNGPHFSIQLILNISAQSPARLETGQFPRGWGETELSEGVGGKAFFLSQITLSQISEQFISKTRHSPGTKIYPAISDTDVQNIPKIQLCRFNSFEFWWCHVKTLLVTVVFFSITVNADDESKSRITKLYQIHTNKTCLVKPDLREWKSATDNWQTKFYIGFKYALTCAFIVPNLKSINISQQLPWTKQF